MRADESPIVVYTGVAAELGPDAAIAESRAIGSQDPLLRRSYVRAVFAFVEGMSYSLRYLAEHAPHFSPDARRRAREAARAEKRFTKREGCGSLDSAVRVAFAAFAAAGGYANPLVASGEDWKAFCLALAIRHRITHPRSHVDCHVSADDFGVVQRAHHWYQGLEMALLQNVQ
jgi:hypothetical protein